MGTEALGGILITELMLDKAAEKGWPSFLMRFITLHNEKGEKIKKKTRSNRLDNVLEVTVKKKTGTS